MSLLTAKATHLSGSRRVRFLIFAPCRFATAPIKNAMFVVDGFSTTALASDSGSVAVVVAVVGPLPGLGFAA